MNFSRFSKHFPRAFRSQFDVTFTRNNATQRKFVEPPKWSGDHKQKMSGFGKFLFLIPVTTFSLGCWQVKRKIWKENLIKEMEKKFDIEAIPIPDNLEDLNHMEYQTVSVRGEFIHEREIYLGPRSFQSPKGEDRSGGGVFSTASSSGYQVITPFKLDGREEIILVNRGWVSRKHLNPNARKGGQINGLVEIEGIVRLEETRPQFSPEHRGGPFLYRDLPKMCALAGANPYYIEAKYDPDLTEGPIGGQTRASLRNEHLSYIITWYSLSALTGILWYRTIFKRIPV